MTMMLLLRAALLALSATAVANMVDAAATCTAMSDASTAQADACAKPGMAAGPTICKAEDKCTFTAATVTPAGTPCDIGTHSTDGNKDTNGDCTACMIGSGLTTAAAGTTTAVGCICPANKFPHTVTVGDTSAIMCTACGGAAADGTPKGTSAAGSTAATDCSCPAADMYMTLQSGVSVCMACGGPNSGGTSAVGSSSAADCQCPAGHTAHCGNVAGEVIDCGDAAAAAAFTMTSFCNDGDGPPSGDEDPPPDCVKTCADQPTTCAEYNVIVATGGCAASCTDEVKLVIATDVDSTNKCVAAANPAATSGASTVATGVAALAAALAMTRAF